MAAPVLAPSKGSSTPPSGVGVAPGLSILRLAVDLDDEERRRYEALLAPYERRVVAGETDDAIALTPEGRTALRHFRSAIDLAAFPRAKRALVRTLLGRHHAERLLVFAPGTAAAFRIAEDELIPVIASEIGASERARTLEKLEEGKVRAIVANGLYLEEHEAQRGCSLPAVRVAIVVSGLVPPPGAFVGPTFGPRVARPQERAPDAGRRIGALLLRRAGRVDGAPRAPRRLVVYELVTRCTVDEPPAGTFAGGAR